MVVVLAVVLALGVVAAAIVLPLVLSGDDTSDDTGDRSSSAGEGRGQDQSDGPEGPEVVVPEDTGDLSAVETYENAPLEHLAPGETTEYPQTPPVGGPHAQQWLECGVYDEPLPYVHAVHDLEHGTVWITYREDQVDEAGRAALADRLPDNGLLSPEPGQTAPVVVTVWGRQLALTGPDDSRLVLFIEAYGASQTAPEPFASCHGGLDPADVGDLPGGGTAA